MFDQQKDQPQNQIQNMKLTLKEKLRLAELKSKNADNLTEDEKKELGALVKKATDLSLDIDQIVKDYAPDADGADGADGDDGKSLTSDELATLITDAVKKSIPDNSGVDTDKLVTEIKSAIGSNTAPSLAELEAVIVKHVGGTSIDKAALVAAIKEAMPADKGVTAEEFKKLFSDFASAIKMPRKTEFGDGRKQLIESRTGNLTVWEKQLLNLCLQNVSPSAQEATIKAGGSIPKGINDGIPEQLLKDAAACGDRRIKAMRENALLGGKTLTTGGVGSGAELVPVDLSSQLQERLYLESQLAMEMMASEIPMPTDPFKLPMVTTRPTFYVGSENPGSDPTASSPGTAQPTLDAKKLIGMSPYSYEADEDSIAAVLNIVMDGLSKGSAAAYESALIEGDDSATHQHSDYHAVANHHAKLFKGFRKYAIAGSVTVDLSTGNINYTNFKAMRKKMNKFGVKPGDLLLICGSMGYNDLVGLDETLTFEKVGNAAAARILTGEAASLAGARIVVSEALREDLNASGVYDGSVTTKGSLLLVHRPSWMVGVRRGFTLEVEVDKKQQVNYVIASFRRAFIPKETPSLALPSVCLGYNNAA